MFRGREGAWHVFLVEDGQVRERAVRIGHVNDDYGEVIDGIGDGATVVLNPANDLAPGERVKRR